MFSTVVMGIADTATLIVAVDPHGAKGFAVWVFLALLGMSGGFCWTLMMWEFLVKPYADRAKVREALKRLESSARPLK